MTTTAEESKTPNMRQRRPLKHRDSDTVLPWVSEDGALMREETPIPSNRKRGTKTTTESSSPTNNAPGGDLSSSESSGSPRKAMSGKAVKKDESRLKKILVRLVSGVALVRNSRVVMNLCVVDMRKCSSLCLRASSHRLSSSCSDWSLCGVRLSRSHLRLCTCSLRRVLAGKCTYNTWRAHRD